MIDDYEQEACDPINVLYRERYLLAVLDHRRREAAHPAFPGPAYPTTRREAEQIWHPLVLQGHAEIILHPVLAVVITAQGQKQLEQGVQRRNGLKRPGRNPARIVQAKPK